MKNIPLRFRNYLTAVRFGLLACGLASALSFAGCAQGPVVLAGDEEEATTIVAQTLEAWQAGQNPDELEGESPKIHVADEDWRSGKSLKSFEVQGAPLETGGHWRVRAVLTLTADGHAELKKPVAYAVTLEPAITVLRAVDVYE